VPQDRLVYRALTKRGHVCHGGFVDGGTVSDTIPKRVRISEPDGRGSTIDLPLPPPSGRWLPRIKFLIVAAVDSGRLSMPEACKLYGLTSEELLSWRSSFNRHGYHALQATRVQKYRPTAARRLGRARRAFRQ
jgi:Protein of unknown function (DUF1153)